MLVVFDLIRNMKLAAAFIFFYLLIGSSALYSLLDTILAGSSGSSFSVRLILPVGSLSVISFNDPGTLVTSLITGLVFISLTFMLELFYFRRRDLMV